MRLFENRPLACLCMAFLGGLIIASVTEGQIGYLPGLLSVLFLVLLPLIRGLLPQRKRPSRKRALFLVFLSLCILGGQLLALGNKRYLASFADTETAPSEIVVEVTEVIAESAYGSTARGEICSIDGLPQSGLIEWELSADYLVCRGDCVSFTATLVPVDKACTATEAIPKKADGICAVALDVGDLRTLSSAPDLADRLRDMLDGLRGGLSYHLLRHIPGEAGRLMSAMLFGERSLLSAETQRDFRRVGMSHILAISGLHLGILIGVLRRILRKMGLGRKIAIGIEAGAILFYMALTGFPLSVVRAGIMLLLVLLSSLAAREPDNITSLLTAATLICLFSPFSVYDCGFWLSVTATFGILVSDSFAEARPMRKEKFLTALCRTFFESLRVCLGAIAATLPLTVLFFGEFSILCLPTNLLLAPLFSLCLTLALAALLLAPIPPFSLLCGAMGEALLWLIARGSACPNALLSLDRPGVPLLLLLTGVTVFLLLCTSVSRKKILAVGICGLTATALCFTVFYGIAINDTAVYYRAQGNEEALLFLSEGKGLLCDISTATYAGTVTPTFELTEEARLCELEGYLLTHYHARHPDAFRKVAERTVIRCLYLPTPQSAAEEEIYHELIAVAEEKAIAYERYEPMSAFGFGKLSLTAHPPSRQGSSHTAFGLTVRSEAHCLTYLSRAAHEGKGYDVAEAAVAVSDLLIFGLHGPKESLPINYPVYCKDISLVLAAEAQERFPAELYALLTERAEITEDVMRKIDLS